MKPKFRKGEFVYARFPFNKEPIKITDVSTNDGKYMYSVRGIRELYQEDELFKKERHLKQTDDIIKESNNDIATAIFIARQDAINMCMKFMDRNEMFKILKEK